MLGSHNSKKLTHHFSCSSFHCPLAKNLRTFRKRGVFFCLLGLCNPLSTEQAVLTTFALATDRASSSDQAIVWIWSIHGVLSAFSFADKPTSLAWTPPSLPTFDWGAHGLSVSCSTWTSAWSTGSVVVSGYEDAAHPPSRVFPTLHIPTGVLAQAQGKRILRGSCHQAVPLWLPHPHSRWGLLLPPLKWHQSSLAGVKYWGSKRHSILAPLTNNEIHSLPLALLHWWMWEPSSSQTLRKCLKDSSSHSAFSVTLPFPLPAPLLAQTLAP